MSFAQRQPLAAALSTVPGVQGYAYKPGAARVGDAWPKWAGDAHEAPGAFTTTWEIYVLVPRDDAGQEEWIEAHRDALIEALAPVLWVDQVTPGLSGDSPALVLTGRE